MFSSYLLISLSQKQVYKTLKNFSGRSHKFKDAFSVVYLLARFSNNLIQTGRESLRQRIEMKVGLFFIVVPERRIFRPEITSRPLKPEFSAGVYRMNYSLVLLRSVRELYMLTLS